MADTNTTDTDTADTNTMIIGLTGSIGMGKSTTTRMLRDMGISVFDADAAVHDLYNNEAVIVAIGALFPLCLENGKINRKILSETVFQNKLAIKQLEALFHPLVREAQDKFIKTCSRRREPLCVLDIPLLFESGRENEFHKILVVSAPFHIQKQRVMARPGMTEEKFNSIIARQYPDAEKRKRADAVIDTGLNEAHARKQLEKIIADWKAEQATKNVARPPKASRRRKPHARNRP